MTTRQRKITTPVGFSAGHYKKIAIHVVQQIQSDNFTLVSAGVAFYFLLAVFPLLAGTISLYGLLVDANELHAHISLLIGILPEQSRYILEEQLQAIITQSNSELGWGFSVSIILSLWSASKGAEALIKACNITYNEENSRGFFIGVVIRLLVTIAMILTIIVSLFLITIMPTLVSYVTSISVDKTKANWISWPTLFVIFNFALAALYRYAPDRSNAQWKWVSVGALLATILWLAASFSFSYYVTEYATYNQTYGSVGGIIVLLMWFYVSAIIILVGSEINAALELYTDVDSTVGPDKPKGERGAVVADTSPDHR